MSLPGWIRFTVVHGGFSFELGATLRGHRILGVTLLRRAPSTYQKHIDAWQDVSDAADLITRLLKSGVDCRALMLGTAGGGIVGAVLDSCFLRMAEFKRVSGDDAA